MSNFKIAGLIWPEAMVSPEAVREGYNKALRDTTNRALGIQEALSLAAFAHTLAPSTPKTVMPTLAESIEKKESNCFNGAALAAIAAQALGLNAMPTVRARAIDTKKQVHAFTMLSGPNGLVLSDPNFGAAKYFGDIAKSDWAIGWPALLAEEPGSLEANGVIQLRFSKIPGVKPELLHDEETAKKIACDVNCVDTFFIGQEGLRSYLELVDTLAAKSRNEKINYDDKEIVIPRI